MGNKEGRVATLLRLIGIIVLVALVILTVVTLIGWLAGWQMASQFGSGFIWGGVAAIALGVLSIVGGWGTTRDSDYLYAQSASHQSMHERTRQSLRDSLRSYNLVIVTGAAGGLCLLIGSLVQTLG
jgi:amino acid transporter